MSLVVVNEDYLFVQVGIYSCNESLKLKDAVFKHLISDNKIVVVLVLMMTATVTQRTVLYFELMIDPKFIKDKCD